jgi:ribonuclease J
MTFDFKAHKDDLLFVPLGGSNEVGMNLNLYTIHGKWLMIDCGIGFAGEYLPGIEVMVPDISFIAERRDDLVGLVVTHAHEDHLGAIPYLWEELRCPIYTTPFTAALLKHKLAEAGLANRVPIHELQPGMAFDLGPFAMEMVGITHSIPEMQAIALTTDKGVVMHTGDWKFDDNPMVGPASDEAKLSKYGDGNVLAMVCDSTNVFVEGEAGSEMEVRKHLTALIQSCKQRVAVGTFASNIARIETIILAAEEAGRHVALAGRSIRRMVEAAQESGYLKEHHEFIDDRSVMGVPRNDVVLICTGSQGEPRATLSRIARGDHPSLRLNAGDTVIFASRKIPGNESRINWIQNKLTEMGIEVVTDRKHFIHVSGHPGRTELEKMYKLVRPRIAVPTHGEARHLHEHAKLARSLGVPEAVEANNGSVILLSEGDAAVIGRVQSGYVAVDGNALIPSDSPVIRTRRKLRDDGAVFVTVAVDERGQLTASPLVSAPGSMDDNADSELLEHCVEEAQVAAGRIKKSASDAEIKEAVQSAVRRVLNRELEKKPVLIVHVVRT